MAAFFTNIKVGTRVYILSALMAIGMLVMILISVNTISSLLTDSYRLNTETAVDMAYSVVKDFKDQSDSGLLSEEEAKRIALEYISKIRYDGDNYVWINDMAGTMLMHPTSPKLNNTDVRGIKDADGKALFVDMINLLKKNDVVEYRYQWPPNNTAKPKLSMVRRIKGWDWVLGTGVYVDKIKTETTKEAIEMGSVALVVLFIALIIALFIGRSISKPIQTITDIMRQLADGTLSVVVGMDDRKDEIGAMAKTVKVFQENLKQVEKLKKEQEEADALAKAEKRKSRNDLADSFEENVGKIVNLVASASTEMQSNAKNLSDMSQQTSVKTKTVADATEEASNSVGTVAAAAEQLSVSIGEINRQIDQSSKIAESAVDEVKRTDRTVSTLSEAATEIGDVVRLIQDIAEQTNLLALNATIEAARAGEAGKGFAVVASEVKNLATQTGSATEDISDKIITVQGVAEEAATAIRSIGSIIEEIDNITRNISLALKQQEDATKEISNNVQQASSGTKEISNNIINVTHTAQESYDASTETLGAANELSAQSERLRSEITKFLSTVRQG